MINAIYMALGSIAFVFGIMISVFGTAIAIHSNGLAAGVVPVILGLGLAVAGWAFLSRGMELN
ncbi:hypothetical protein KBA63_04590 [Candidatus Woesebacteria bacterium]|jgi:hypothetical protein|nr:hypothetical protein [Candidatus Woesebacteria bacterium]